MSARGPRHTRYFLDESRYIGDAIDLATSDRCFMRQDETGYSCIRCGVSWIVPSDKPPCYRDRGG